MHPSRSPFSSPFFFFNDPAPTEIYTLSLHDALPISPHFRRIRSLIHHQDPDKQERCCTNGHVRERLPNRLALVQARSEGERNGYSHSEKERGKHQINKRHPLFP